MVDRRWPAVFELKRRLGWNRSFSLGVFLIPIIAIIVGGVIGVTKLILKHQERIAMIERGIHPDAPTVQPGVQQR